MLAVEDLVSFGELLSVFFVHWINGQDFIKSFDAYKEVPACRSTLLGVKFNLLVSDSFAYFDLFITVNNILTD